MFYGLVRVIDSRGDDYGNRSKLVPVNIPIFSYLNIIIIKENIEGLFVDNLS